MTRVIMLFLAKIINNELEYAIQEECAVDCPAGTDF